MKHSRSKKIECDECHKLIDRHFVRVEFNEKELDRGLTILRGDLDFCSLTCLESWLDHKRRWVTKISEKIPCKVREKIGIYPHDKLILDYKNNTLILTKQKRSVFDLQLKEVAVGTLKNALIFERNINKAGKKDF